MDKFDYIQATLKDVSDHLKTLHEKTYYRMRTYYLHKKRYDIVLKLEKAALINKIGELQKKLEQMS